MLFYVVVGVIFIWLAVLSYFLFKTKKHYRSLTARTGKHNIEHILDKLMEDDQKFTHEIGLIKKEIIGIINKSRSYYHKVGLVRFDPFSKKGMDQSFALALLNEENNGIVINFIYMHEGVRVYLKRVKNGKGDDYQLSDEEKEAINKAEL